MAELRAGSGGRSATALSFYSLPVVPRIRRTPKPGVGGLRFGRQASVSRQSERSASVYGDPVTCIGSAGWDGPRVRPRTKPAHRDRSVAYSHRCASVWAARSDALDVGVRRQRSIKGAGGFLETSGRARYLTPAVSNSRRR